MNLTGMAAHAAKRVDRLKKEDPVESLRGRPLYARLALDPSTVLTPGAKIVEIRFADPDSGFLVPKQNANPSEAARLAREAEQSGAVGVAIWVDRHFHAGEHSHIEAARAACPKLFLIARDFVMDPWQIERARAAGADALELIPELLGPALPSVAAAVRSLGLVPIVWGDDAMIRAAQ